MILEGCFDRYIAAQWFDFEGHIIVSEFDQYNGQFNDRQIRVDLMVTRLMHPAFVLITGQVSGATYGAIVEAIGPVRIFTYSFLPVGQPISTVTSWLDGEAVDWSLGVE